MAVHAVRRLGLEGASLARGSARLEQLRELSAAFVRGDLGIDKVVELTRFATSETERELVDWARDVSSGRIRHQGDLARRETVDEVCDVDRDRSLAWWYFDEGRRFGLKAELGPHRARSSRRPSDDSRTRFR